jgi:hypothetical protein
VLHQPDRHLVDEFALASQGLGVRAAVQAFQLGEDAVELPVVGGEDVDHVALYLGHELSSATAGPSLRGPSSPWWTAAHVPVRSGPDTPESGD